MSKKLFNSKKDIIMAVLVVLVVGLIIFIICLVTQKQNLSFEYEGWINCQPILTPEEADLCARARAANYPYIAY